MISKALMPLLSLTLMQPSDGAVYRSPPPVAAQKAALDCLGPSAPLPKDHRAALEDALVVQGALMSSPEEIGRMADGAGDKRLIIAGGDFTGADMRGVAPKLQGTCFYLTVLDETDWRGTEIEGLQFERASLRKLKANRASWPSLRTRGVSFEGSDFSEANLSGMHFVSQYQGASFDDISFRGADLSDARFDCGLTVDVWCINGPPDLSGADLAGADISSLGLWNAASMTGATLDRTVVAPRQLEVLIGSKLLGGLIVRPQFSQGLASEQTPTARLSPGEARNLIAALATKPDPAPSFDCAKAASAVEQMICGEYTIKLRRLDREMAELWSAARAARKASLTQQRAWLRSRAQCDNSPCLEDSYRTRIAQLSAQLGRVPVLAPDQSITFHSDVLDLPDTARSGAVYERILPVLKAATWQTVTLTGMEDGSIRAEGDAIGGNAHLCGLNIPAARYDPESGWWTATTSDGLTFELFRFSDRRIEFRYSGNLGNTPVEATDFISCGARAGFDDGIDLTPSP
ncbi:MAG: hypothetical protein AAF127_13510 [Pseudomonadota bacterium]